MTRAWSERQCIAAHLKVTFGRVRGGEIHSHTYYLGSFSTSKEPELTLAGEKINPMHGSNHWSFERLLSVGVFGLIGAAAACPHKMIDFAMGVVIPLHCHIGFGSIVTDYLPKRKFPVIGRFSQGLLYAATGLSIYGFYRYNTEDVGITEGVKQLWHAKKEEK